MPRLSTFGRVLINFAASQLIANILRFISGFLVVRLLVPEDYGIYSGIGVYLGYFALGHFGIINGLGREFPYQLGKGKDEYGKQLANSAYVVTFFIGIISALSFLILSIYHFSENNNLLGITFLTYVIIAGLDLFNSQLLPVLYRTSSDFNKLAKINIIFGLFNLLSVVLVWRWGFNGLLIRGVALSIIQFYLLFSNKPYEVKLRPIKNDLITLFKTGFPIYLVGQVNPLWITIVNNIIFAMGGARFFGLYSLANIVQSTAQIIPASFGKVIYPRMSIMYGKGKTPSEIIRLNMKPFFFQFLLILTIAIAGSILLPVIIPWILPKYVDGIPAAQWIIFIPVMYSFEIINNIFNVTGKQKLYFISLLFGAIVGTLFIFFNLLNKEFDLLIFPKGMVLGILLQQILSIFFASRLK